MRIRPHIRLHEIFLDESADFRLGRYLAELGHDVTAISRDFPQSLDDIDVLAIAVRESRILITHDRDFGEIIFRESYPHPGVILFRMSSRSLAIAARLMDEIIEHHANDLMHFIVVTEHGIRVRHSPGA